MKRGAQLLCWSRQRKMYHFQNVLALCALTISWKVKSVAYSLVDLKFPEVSAACFYLYLTWFLLFASVPFPSYPAKAGCLSRLRSAFMFSNAVITCLFWRSIYILLWFIVLKNKIISQEYLMITESKKSLCASLNHFTRTRFSENICFKTNIQIMQLS